MGKDTTIDEIVKRQAMHKMLTGEQGNIHHVDVDFEFTPTEPDEYDKRNAYMDVYDPLMQKPLRDNHGS